MHFKMVAIKAMRHQEIPQAKKTYKALESPEGGI